MRRNENIIALSRDHHFSLLFCWKIREGLKRNIELQRISGYIAYFWKSHLNRHFEEEETVLFTLRQDEYCSKAIDEHRQIKTLVDRITIENAYSEIIQLVDLMDRHIRYEERVLFPHLENSLSVDQLTSIGLKLKDMHTSKTVDDYPDEFWTEVVTGNSGQDK